jgi:hypothetical protein
MRDGLAKLQFRRLEETAARVVDTPRELRVRGPASRPSGGATTASACCS